MSDRGEALVHSAGIHGAGVHSAFYRYVALADPAALSAAATATNVSNASQLVVNTLRTDPATNTALGANFDPLSTAFTANSTGIDAVLDSLEVTTDASGVTITNLAAPVSGSGRRVAASA